MKIAIASNDQKTISAHFGRTAGFIIYNVENDTIKGTEYRKNDFTFHAKGMIDAPHNIDRHAPILNALNDCEVVISNGMGRRIYEDLKSANIEAYIVQETEAEEAINLYINNELKDNPDKGCEH